MFTNIISLKFYMYTMLNEKLCLVRNLSTASCFISHTTKLLAILQ